MGKRRIENLSHGMPSHVLRLHRCRLASSRAGFVAPLTELHSSFLLLCRRSAVIRVLQQRLLALFLTTTPFAHVQFEEVQDDDGGEHLSPSNEDRREVRVEEVFAERGLN